MVIKLLAFVLPLALDSFAIAAALVGRRCRAGGRRHLGHRRLVWLDPAAALLIAVVVAYHALALVRKIIAAITTTNRSAPAG